MAKSIQQILTEAGYGGWTYGQPVAETKQIQSNIPGRPPDTVPTGRHILVITDGKGHSLPFILRQAKEERETQNGPVEQVTGWEVEEAPTAPPKTETPAATGEVVRVNNKPYVWDAKSGSYVPAPGLPDAVPNADDEIIKSIQRQSAEATRNERQANADSGKGYMTNAEAQQFEQTAAAMNLSQNQAKLARDKFEADNRRADEELRLRTAESGANVEATRATTQLTGARVGQVGAETRLTDAQIAALQSKTPAEIQEMEARGELTRAQAAEVRQRSQAPTLVSEGLQTPYLTTRGPTGEIQQSGINLAYQPKTMAEVQARVGQLQAASQAKRDELLEKTKADPNYTADMALREWNAWYDRNVGSQLGALQAAQEEAQRARGTEEAGLRQQNLDAVTRMYQAQRPAMVGPRAAEVLSQAARGERNLDMAGAAFYDRPDLMSMAEQMTMRALSGVSPAAAQAVGGPAPGLPQQDIRGMLDRTQYAGAFGPQPAPAPPVQAPSPAGGAQGVTINIQGGQPQPAPPPPQQASPGWMRADQSWGQTPQGNAMAPAPGMTGRVLPGDPRYIGSLVKQPPLPDYNVLGAA